MYDEGRSDWASLAPEERLDVENLVLLVSILFGMCKTNLVIESQDDEGLNDVNIDAARKQMDTAESCLKERGLG